MSEVDQISTSQIAFPPLPSQGYRVAPLLKALLYSGQCQEPPGSCYIQELSQYHSRDLRSDFGLPVDVKVDLHRLPCSDALSLGQAPPWDPIPRMLTLFPSHAAFLIIISDEAIGSSKILQDPLPTFHKVQSPGKTNSFVTRVTALLEMVKNQYR